MKKYLLIFIFLFALASCEDDLTSLNENPKKPVNVQYETLFSNAQIELTDIMTNSDVNENIFRLLAQHWTETTYTDESNYDLGGRNIPQYFWHILYRDVLNDLAESRQLMESDESGTNAAVKANQLALIHITEVYTYSVLVNTFGNIPYSEALDIDNIRPSYDDAAAIYDDLIAKLNNALGSLDPSAESFGSADLLYGGDVAMWIKFGNSLKLKLGMMLADVAPTKAATIVEEAAPNVFQSNNDNAVFEYSSVPPNTNPIWEDLVQSGRKDFVAANTLVDVMMTLDDPRIPLFFTTDAEGDYSGGIYGASNNYATFSKPNETITTAEFEALLLDYQEVEFFLAEAVERGMNVGGTAAEHYNNAITASIRYWGGTAADAAAYLANPEVAYATASDNWKEKIGIQKWIGLYNQGFSAWTEWRRLDYPQLEAPEEALSEIPLRYTYPVSEQNLNKPSYNEASSAIGGDLVTTKLFWDMH